MRVLLAHQAWPPAADAIIVDWRVYEIWAYGTLCASKNTAAFRIRALFVIVAATSGQVERDDAIDFVWGDDPDGGPEGANYRIAVELARLTPFFSRLGIVIEKEWGRGWRACFMEQQRGRSAA